MGICNQLDYADPGTISLLGTDLSVDTTDEFGNSLRNQIYEMGAANEANIKVYTSVNVVATITPLRTEHQASDYTYAANNSSGVQPGITYWAADLWVVPMQ